MPLWKSRYPDCLNPKSLPNYSDGEVMWTYRQIVRRDDCPHLLTPENEKNRRAMEREYGVNSSFIRSMIYGEFVASEDDNVIFEPMHIEQARRAMRGEFRPFPGDQRFAGDVSEGGDKMVFGAREGSNIVWLKGDDFTDSLDCSDAWVKRLTALGASPHQFTMDAQGAGKTTATYMETRLGFWGIHRFGHNNLPHEKLAFADRYTELHWNLREILELEAIALPDCMELIRDMRERRFVSMPASGKIKAEPKKAHRHRCNGRSPDYLDTLIYLLYDFQMAEVRGKFEEQRREMEAKQRILDDDAPTQFEIDAAKPAGSGNTDSFSTLKSVPSFLELAKYRS